MIQSRRFVGLPLIAVGLAFIALGLGPGKQRAFLGSGIALIVVGAGLTARARRQGPPV